MSIEDDGPGVPEADQSKLFLPFFTTREPGQGTGLGLSVSFGIVAGHGGLLSFAPRPGGGSVFTIELPIDVPAVEPMPEAASTPLEAPAKVAIPTDAPATVSARIGATHVPPASMGGVESACGAAADPRARR